MNLLSIFLQAPAAANGGIMNIVMIVAIVAIFYFFMIRPQAKRQKEIKAFRESLSVGDRVVTAGGIHGKIKELRDDENVVILTVMDGVHIRVSKESIYQTVPEQQA